jgi:uncharacterized RDD family membrane protein YckC
MRRATLHDFVRLVFMNCPLCGELCSCNPEPPAVALPRWRSDAVPTPATGESLASQNSPDSEPTSITGFESASEDHSAVQSADADSANPAESSAAAESGVPEIDAAPWRDELSDRLSRYRARRKMRPPRYPSLSLQFESRESYVAYDPVETANANSQFQTISDNALALDGMRLEPPAEESTEADRETDTDRGTKAKLASQSGPLTGNHSGQAPASAARSTGKIIEFPRFAWGPPPPPPDQLAEPVRSRPRILEAPEIAPPAPALGGITIEAAERHEVEKRIGIDIPLQSASLARRMLAGTIDALIVIAAAALFGFIFWKVAAVRPPQIQILGLAGGITSLFWAAYEYLLIVYAGSTPGMRAAGLELARFDGSPASRSLRRWRVLASYLSAASLGMGYAWLFLDEDVLCWHDRITHTYLAPGSRNSQDDTLAGMLAND